MDSTVWLSQSVSPSSCSFQAQSRRDGIWAQVYKLAQSISHRTSRRWCSFWRLQLYGWCKAWFWLTGISPLSSYTTKEVVRILWVSWTLMSWCSIGFLWYTSVRTNHRRSKYVRTFSQLQSWQEDTQYYWIATRDDLQILLLRFLFRSCQAHRRGNLVDWLRWDMPFL